MSLNSPFFDRRVLLVGDEMLVAWLLEDMLARRGMRLLDLTAEASPPALLSAARLRSPDY
jgi:hypothetical protein